MKLDRFFEKFELFAEAPDAVARMREVVLELAVRGKLTKQKTEDTKDPEWQKLTALLDADTHQSSAIFQQPFIIPTSWKWATLEKLGNSKPRNDIAETTKCSFVPMKHIPSEYGSLVQHEERIWGEIKKGYTHFKNDDVVLAKITPCFENGKSAVMKGLMGGYGAGTTELHVFRPGSKAILPEFVLVYLKTRGFISRGEPQMTGSAGQKRVPHAYFARSPFPLPPLAEQKRIVAKVDELMALCDQLEAQQQERQTRHAALVQASLARFTQDPTPANLQFLFHPSCTVSPADLRKTILTLAVQGKLVRQDQNDEPAERIIERVIRERNRMIREKLIPKAKKLSKPGDNPYPLPSSWCWAQLGMITFLIEYGTSQKSNDDTSHVPVYRMGDIQEGRLFDGRLKYVPPQIDDLPRLFLDPGDILFNRTNSAELVGKAAIYKGTPNTHTFASYLIRVRVPAHHFEPEFINVCFRAPYFRVTQIEPEIIQQCGQANFNGTKLAHTLFPIPPLNEQRRIVAKVDELLALIDELETQLAASRTVAQNLLAALVRELTTTP